MRRPLIIVCATAYRPFIGGAEVAIEEVAKRLVGEFDFLIIAARLSRKLSKQEAYTEGMVERIGVGHRIDKFLLFIWGIVVCVRKIREAAKERRPILLWGMDISQGSVLATLIKTIYRRIPFVLTIQYGYGEERLQKGRLGMMRVALQWMLGVADEVTAISRYLSDIARTFGYKRVVAIIYNGVDVKLFQHSGAEKYTRPTIITVSRLVVKNGVDIFIRAIAELRDIFPRISGMIIGDGPERTRLESLTDELGVKDYMAFLGSIPNNEVSRYLARAHVFARPSRTEGMGNVFVEALSVGVPIIGTDVGGIRDIIEDGQTGLLVRVDDPHDLAKKIQQLFDDKELAARIVKRGQEMVKKKFSWDKIAVQYKHVFNQLLKDVQV